MHTGSDTRVIVGDCVWAEILVEVSPVDAPCVLPPYPESLPLSSEVRPLRGKSGEGKSSYADPAETADVGASGAWYNGMSQQDGRV